MTKNDRRRAPGFGAPSGFKASSGFKAPSGFGFRGGSGRRSGTLPGARLRRAAAAKLSSTAGDTLVEILVALLVSVMAVTLMAGMLTTATNVTSRNETRMAELFAAQSSLSVDDAACLKESRVSATVSGGLLDPYSVEVDVYEANGFLRYGLSEKNQAGGQ